MLFKHQEEGAAWLAARARGILGDTPGLGKTRTLLQALKLTAAPLPLVVCPASVRSHWQREADLLEIDIVVQSYDELVYHGMPRMAELLLRRRVGSLIIDEFHKCKTISAQRTQLLLGKDGYARRMERVYPASGTPIAKNPFEFWTILASCFPEVAHAHGLKTAADFQRRFCVTYWDDKRRAMRFAPKVVNPDEFKAILAEVMLRRTLESVGIQLPDVWWQTVNLDGGILPAETEFALNEMAEQEQPDLLKPSYKSARQELGMVKAPIVAKWLLDELGDGEEKVVVFAYHRAVLNLLRDAWAPLGVCYIDGDTSPKRREQEIDWFQNNPAKRVFLGQQMACQEGITLTAAHRVVLVEPSWTGMHNVQAAMRVARIGQKSNLCIAQMVCLSHTADVAITINHRREVELCSGLLDGRNVEGDKLQGVRTG